MVYRRKTNKKVMLQERSFFPQSETNVVVVLLSTEMKSIIIIIYSYSYYNTMVAYRYKYYRNQQRRCVNRIRNSRSNAYNYYYSRCALETFYFKQCFTIDAQIRDGGELDVKKFVAILFNESILYYTDYIECTACTKSAAAYFYTMRLKCHFYRNSIVF